ncbi:pantetheine-phosphate adenylyltransferase [Mycoplasmopsis phocirhinis]|uniref:Pantetheine-phosphate adenylyltransferase n=1 Tax=Mycoplasmopsis phocirhinis TaxID=142650 RepID=A0A4P6MM55_9BACT|nr:pantetheine-phosphate adenylyltransferase [Mycoplasmopsis phocirhinis]QBF34558.1 pantetheine-phosphate adenylyltransferase [Mycoplasmopsis phocirhinis]
MKKAIYAGSFDPLHDGHKAVIQKALKLIDELTIVVSNNPDKNNLQGIEQRYSKIKQYYANDARIKVIVNKNELIAHIAAKLGINFLIRSARNDIDYKTELDIAAGNNQVKGDLETILIIPDYKMIGISSTLIRHQKAIKKD